jgi:MazG family protein
MSHSEAGEALGALLDLMERLRDPQRGCPWDREQTFASIAPYTIEEAYEVRDAIERGSPQALREELGDLLFQVVFHARMADERGWFGFAAVARSIHEKLVRRHAHVLGEREQAADAARQSEQWDEIKAHERSQRAREGAGEDSALADVPLALPALMRAMKLGRRAARVGFDWEHPAQVRDKVLEELGEVDAALAGGADPGEIAEEIGDLLFAVANWSLHLAVDPEEALRAANVKFERRFRRMERLARERGAALGTLSAAQWEALWSEAKRQG